MTKRSWIRMSAEALPNPGTQGSWWRRLAEGLANLGTFDGRTVGPLDGRGSWPQQLWKALDPRPAHAGTNWPQRIGGGSGQKLCNAVLASIAIGEEQPPAEPPAWLPDGAIFAFKPEENQTHAWLVDQLVPVGDVLALAGSAIGAQGISGEGTITLTGELLALLRSMAADAGYSLATTFTVDADVSSGVSWRQGYNSDGTGVIFSVVVFLGTWLVSWADEGGPTSAQDLDMSALLPPFSTGAAFTMGPAAGDFAMAVNGGPPIIGEHNGAVVAPDASGSSVFSIPANFVIDGLFLFPPATGPGFDELTGWTQFAF